MLGPPIDQQITLETYFGWKKGSLESILGSPENPRKSHFERKMVNAKIVQKNVEKLIASAVPRRETRTPDKEGFGRIIPGRQRSSTPSLILRMGGRIVYASRIPPRPLETGGLET